MSIIHISGEEQFNTEVLQASMPIVVDYWADWCGPCRMLAPIIEELEEEFRGKIKVAKIDIDNEPALALTHKIMSIPTVSIYLKGKELKRLVGLRDKPEFADAIREALTME